MFAASIIFQVWHAIRYLGLELPTERIILLFALAAIVALPHVLDVVLGHDRQEYGHLLVFRDHIGILLLRDKVCLVLPVD